MEALRPLTADPAHSALFFDVDGTLAPIVERAADAHVPKETSLLLSRLSRRYALVACISGRAATDVRRLVGVGGIAYAGSHGAELLEPNASAPRIAPDFQEWEPRVKEFVSERDTPELRVLRVRIEDKGPIMTFHWRGAPDEEAARARVEELAAEAEGAGLSIHWGRKVLEIRPPVPIHKGLAVRELMSDIHASRALRGRRHDRPRRVRRAHRARRGGAAWSTRCAWACSPTRARPRSASRPTSRSRAWRA